MSIYSNFRDLLVTYIFGGQTLGYAEELAVTLVSLCACLFLVSLPFLIVWKVFKMI